MKYNSGSGIGGGIGTLNNHQYNYTAAKPYGMSSGINGGIGSLGGYGGGAPSSKGSLGMGDGSMGGYGRHHNSNF